METPHNQRRQATGWIVSAVLAAVGILVTLFASAYRFSGVVLLGIALLSACYTAAAWVSCRRVNAGKLLRLLLNTVVLLGLLAAVATGTLIGWAASGHAGVNCRYIVVLGAGVDGDKPSLSLQERLDAAYTYLANHPKTICIVSGGKGSGEDLSEADCMYRELTQRGISPDRIWKESQATTTRENLRFSIQLIQEHTGSLPTQIGLVSSEYHLYRAERIAASLGVSAVGIPAETSYLSLRVNYFLREIAAVWYYAIFGG